MTPHTPDPWTFCRGGGHAYPTIQGSADAHTNGKLYPHGISSRSLSRVVCQIHGDPDLAAVQANIALICAAPALLAALKEIEDRVHGYSAGSAIVDMDPEATIDSIHKIARAAIALAEGKP